MNDEMLREMTEDLYTAEQVISYIDQERMLNELSHPFKGIHAQSYASASYDDYDNEDEVEDYDELLRGCDICQNPNYPYCKDNCIMIDDY